MSKYVFFSPEEEIRKYFREFAGNIQNKSHSKALEYYHKVENLRECFASFLGIQDTHLISFQFNQYYINRLIFKYLQIDSDWDIYSDSIDLKNEIPEREIYPLKNLRLGYAGNKNKRLVWIDGLKKINLELFEVVSKLTKEISENPCYVFFSLDYLLYSSPQISSFLRECSFLVFAPSILFQEYGVVFFAFRKEIKLSPIFMGSGAAKFNRETKEIEIQELPYSLEIGTQNLISLIILERFFYFLRSEHEQIARRLKTPFLNFNLRENLVPN